jgi:type II secretion system protein G
MTTLTRNWDRFRLSPPRGFTLIELLIVVAIIAILAAIAVPNFLEAQTRSKVARGQADMRSLATALEAYAVEHNRYPYYNHPMDYAQIAGKAIVFTPVRLTTPVAYMSSLPNDVFPGQRSGMAPGTKTPYFYLHNYEVTYLGKYQDPDHVRLHYATLTGSDRPVEWTVWSYGPDLRDDHGIIMYDPTNGTVSRGDFMRFGP